MWQAKTKVHLSSNHPPLQFVTWFPSRWASHTIMWWYDGFLSCPMSTFMPHSATLLPLKSKHRTSTYSASTQRGLYLCDTDALPGGVAHDESPLEDRQYASVDDIRAEARRFYRERSNVTDEEFDRLNLTDPEVSPSDASFSLTCTAVIIRCLSSVATHPRSRWQPVSTSRPTLSPLVHLAVCIRANRSSRPVCIRGPCSKSTTAF